MTRHVDLTPMLRPAREYLISVTVAHRHHAWAVRKVAVLGNLNAAGVLLVRARATDVHIAERIARREVERLGVTVTRTHGRPA